MDEEMWQEEWPVTGSDKGLVGEIEREMKMDERDLGIDPTTASEQPHTDPIPVQVDYDGAKPVSTPAEPSHRLSKVQYPPTVANMAKTKKLPYHEACSFTMHGPTMMCRLASYVMVERKESSVAVTDHIVDVGSCRKRSPEQQLKGRRVQPFLLLFNDKDSRILPVFYLIRGDPQIQERLTTRNCGLRLSHHNLR